MITTDGGNTRPSTIGAGTRAGQATSAGITPSPMMTSGGHLSQAAKVEKWPRKRLEGKESGNESGKENYCK